MAITFEAASSTPFTVAAGTFQFTPDAGTLAGDLFVVHAIAQDTTPFITPPAANVPEVPHPSMALADGDNNEAVVFTWLAPANAPGPVSFGVAPASLGGVQWARFRGVDPIDPVNAFSFARYNGSTGSAPSMTTTVPDSLLVSGWLIDGGASYTDVTPPAAWTERDVLLVQRRLGIATRGPVAAGATGTSGTWTAIPTQFSGPNTVWQLALNPAADVPAGPAPHLGDLPVQAYSLGAQGVGSSFLGSAQVL